MRTILVGAMASVVVACGASPAAGPCPAAPVSAGVGVGAGAGADAGAGAGAAMGERGSGPMGLAVLLRPMVDPSPRVHVEIDLDAPRVPAAWSFVRDVGARVTGATAHDAKGDLAVSVAPRAITLARAPEGAVHVAYDVAASDDALGDPLGEYVAADRFRGSGEGLLALPAMNAMVLTLRIDGDALKVPQAASSLGLGAARRTRGRPEMLQRASFLAGSLGGAVFDDPGSNHDEAAWLGYTSFDPRPAGAELAQMRSAVCELFKAHDEPPWTYLVVAQTRSIGAFTTTARADGVLLQVGPDEPWSAALRLGVAQQIARRFVGGALRTRFAKLGPAGNAAFDAGVARFVAMHVLSGLGLLAPNDVHDAVVGELSVVATRPHGAGDAGPSEAEWVARGALYALAASTAIGAGSKGARSLSSALESLYAAVRDDNGSHLGAREIDEPAWLDAMKDDPDAAKTLATWLDGSKVPALPPTALGPCFRAGAGEYVAYDAGFDLEATRASKEGRALGVRAGGPAAKAGLEDGDVIDKMSGREGDAEVPVQLAITRDGKPVAITYAPRGARGRGQTWTRVKGITDDRCGL